MPAVEAGAEHLLHLGEERRWRSRRRRRAACCLGQDQHRQLGQPVAGEHVDRARPRPSPGRPRGGRRRSREQLAMRIGRGRRFMVDSIRTQRLAGVDLVAGLRRGPRRPCRRPGRPIWCSIFIASSDDERLARRRPRRRRRRATRSTAPGHRRRRATAATAGARSGWRGSTAKRDVAVERVDEPRARRGGRHAVTPAQPDVVELDARPVGLRPRPSEPTGGSPSTRDVDRRRAERGTSTRTGALRRGAVADALRPAPASGCCASRTGCRAAPAASARSARRLGERPAPRRRRRTASPRIRLEHGVVGRANRCRVVGRRRRPGRSSTASR